MAFDSYPDDDGVLDLGPQQSAERPITTLRFDANRLMHLRLVQIAAGGAAPPTLALQADDGLMTPVDLAGGLTALLGADRQLRANAQFAVEQNGVYRIRVSKTATSPLQRMTLQLTNGHATATRSFRWVVADREPETRQPRVIFTPTHLDVVNGHLEPGEVPVRNIGTGDLHITAPPDPALGSGFALDGAPGPVPPNSTGVLTVTYTPPALPPGGFAAASTTYRFATDDTIAQRPERRDAWATITATVRAPLWQAGDVLVVDPRASDGRGSRALIRLDAASGRQTIVSVRQHLVSPAGVAVEATGDVLVADASAVDGNGAVIRVDRVTGVQTVLSAGNLFRDPSAVVVTPQRRIVVADPKAFGNGGLITVDPQTGAQTALSSAPAVQGSFNLTVDDPTTGSLVVLCQNPTGSRRVVRVDPNGGAVVAVADEPVDGIAVDEARRVLLVARSVGAGPTALVAHRPDGTRDVLSTGQLLGDPVRLRREGTDNVLVTDRRAGGGGPGLIRIRLADGAQELLSSGGVLSIPLGLVVVPPLAP